MAANTKKPQANRRAKGTGSVFFDSQKDRWIASLPANGQYPRQRKVCKTKQEAERVLLEMQMSRANVDNSSKQEMTFGNLLNWYETIYIKERLRANEITPSTATSALNLAKRLRQIVNEGLSLSDVNTLAYLDSLKYRLDSTGLARSTQARTIKQLSNIFELAKQRGWLETNQVKSITKLPVKQREAVVLEPEQLTALLTDVKGSIYETYYVIAAPFGLRSMEALGLTWDDVDLENDTIYIRRQLIRLDGQPTRYTRGKLKNKREHDYRAIPLLPHQKDYLLRLRNLHISAMDSDKWANEAHNVICTTKDGHPVDSSAVLSDLKRRCSRLGLPSHTRLHDLRHTSASHLLANGTPIPAVQALLGWSDIRTLMGIYAHLTRQGQDVAVATATRLYGNALD